MTILFHVCIFAFAFFFVRHISYQVQSTSQETVNQREADAFLDQLPEHLSRETRGGARSFITPIPKKLSMVAADPFLVRVLSRDLGFLMEISEEYVQIPELLEVFLRKTELYPRVSTKRQVQLHGELHELKDRIQAWFDRLSTHTRTHDLPRLEEGRETLLSILYRKLEVLTISPPFTIVPEIDAPSAFDPTNNV